MRGSLALAAASAMVAAFSARAAIVPFTEMFNAGAANWTGPAGPAAWNPGAGPDASGAIAADTNVNSAAFGVVIGLRGQASNGASGGAFTGNWLADGVTLFSFSVRHNAPGALTFGARIASAANSPGAIGLDFAPVAPNTWTRVNIPIDPAYPGFVSFEGSSFSAVFSNVGNVQLLYSVPASLAGTGTVVTFEADDVSIVPAPGAAVVAGLIGMVGLRQRR